MISVIIIFVLFVSILLAPIEPCSLFIFESLENLLLRCFFFQIFSKKSHHHLYLSLKCVQRIFLSPPSFFKKSRDPLFTVWLGWDVTHIYSSIIRVSRTRRLDVTIRPVFSFPSFSNKSRDPVVIILAWLGRDPTRGFF